MNGTRITDRDAILATLAYADVFDYPLTRQELSRWLIRAGRPDTKTLQQKNGYYFLPGRSSIVARRKNLRVWQQAKWNIARRAARLLARIPSIHLVGVTGGLAMNNASREDDIDLFIVVKRGTLWTSRLAATILMDLMGLRRHPHEISVANKVCLNMFASTLSIPPRERDLFSAHEVLQMEPVFDRAHTYKKFLQANRWVSTFLPNAWRYRYAS